MTGQILSARAKRWIDLIKKTDTPRWFNDVCITAKDNLEGLTSFELQQLELTAMKQAEKFPSEPGEITSKTRLIGAISDQRLKIVVEFCGSDTFHFS